MNTNYWNVIDLRGSGETVLTTSNYDTNEDGVVDNSELVDGHTVELDIGVIPVSTLQATDDMADVVTNL